MSNAADVLICRAVVRRFREGDSMLEVLSGVDLHVKEAERLAIIGASGSGKSSLLRAGVIPRLKRSGRHWVVLPPMRADANDGDPAASPARAAA